MTYDLIEPSELDVELSFQQPAFPEPTADDLAYLESDHQRRYNPHLQDPTDRIRRRIIIERAIVRRAVADLIAAGYVLRVYYGDDNWGTAFTNDIGTLMAAVGACDEEWLTVARPLVGDAHPARRLVGSLFFVYGNAGWDVICDYSVNLEGALKGANDLAEELSRWPL